MGSMHRHPTPISTVPASLLLASAHVTPCLAPVLSCCRRMLETVQREFIAMELVRQLAIGMINAQHDIAERYRTSTGGACDRAEAGPGGTSPGVEGAEGGVSGTVQGSPAAADADAGHFVFIAGNAAGGSQAGPAREPDRGVRERQDEGYARPHAPLSAEELRRERRMRVSRAGNGAQSQKHEAGGQLAEGAAGAEERGERRQQE